MKMIRALRQFSHYHAGNFSQFETREIKAEWAEALVGMELAEYVETDQAAPSNTVSLTKKAAAKK